MNPIAPTEIVSHGEAVVRSFGETMA